MLTLMRLKMDIDLEAMGAVPGLPPDKMDEARTSLVAVSGTYEVMCLKAGDTWCVLNPAVTAMMAAPTTEPKPHGSLGRQNRIGAAPLGMLMDTALMCGNQCTRKVLTATASLMAKAGEMRQVADPSLSFSLGRALPPLMWA